MEIYPIYKIWNEIKNTYILNLMVLDIETSIEGYIIQVAYNIYNSKFQLIKQYNKLINENVYKVDYFKKFTLSDICKHGIHPIDMLKELDVDLLMCSRVIGHNISFDISRIKKYYIKYYSKCNIIPYFPKSICTMNKTRHIFGKAPKLCNLYHYCFGVLPDDNVHDASYDIQITFDSFVFLFKNNLIDLY